MCLISSKGSAGPPVVKVSPGIPTFNPPTPIMFPAGTLLTISFFAPSCVV